jgi:hypothetical protein
LQPARFYSPALKQGLIAMNYDNLIFLHIPKAAGTTLHPVLERHYKRRNYHNLTTPEEVEAFKQMPETERRRIRLLKGHMPFGMHSHLEGQTRYITILRDPAERIVSHYYYARRIPSHYLHPYIAKGMTLAEYAGSGISAELDNGQVRLLAGHDRDVPCGACTRGMLEIAQRNVAEHFAVAGLTERFDESLVLMAIELGWQWTPYYFNRNVTRGKPIANQIDPVALKAIKEANALDFELYDWAAQRFQERIKSRLEDVDRRVIELGRANSLYQPLASQRESVRRNLKKLRTAIREFATG